MFDWHNQVAVFTLTNSTFPCKLSWCSICWIFTLVLVPVSLLQCQFMLFSNSHLLLYFGQQLKSQLKGIANNSKQDFAHPTYFYFSIDNWFALNQHPHITSTIRYHTLQHIVYSIQPQFDHKFTILCSQSPLNPLNPHITPITELTHSPTHPPTHHTFFWFLPR